MSLIAASLASIVPARPAGGKRQLGLFTDGAETPEATHAFVRTQYDLCGKVINEIGLQPE